MLKLVRRAAPLLSFLIAASVGVAFVAQNQIQDRERRETLCAALADTRDILGDLVESSGDNPLPTEGLDPAEGNVVREANERADRFEASVRDRLDEPTPCSE